MSGGSWRGLEHFPSYREIVASHRVGVATHTKAEPPNGDLGVEAKLDGGRVFGVDGGRDADLCRTQIRGLLDVRRR